MARPPLEIGTGGSVTTKHHPDKQTGDQWKAYCSFRDMDGKTRQVERWGKSRAAAKANLAAALRDRVPRADSVAKLTAASRFREAAELWLPRIERRRAIRTVQAYRWVLAAHVLPALGDVRIGECTPSRLDVYLEELEERGYAADTRRNIKTVISGVLGLAVSRGALMANPAREMARIEGAKRKVRALTPDERADFLARLDELRCARHLDDPERARACRMCAAARGDLPDLVRFMLGTGVRIGEALAVRWCDLDLVGVEVRVAAVTQLVRTAAIGPTLVREPGRGLVRQDDGKTRAATRTIVLPEYLVTLLTVRRPADATPESPVFPSTAYTWWDPANAQDAMRKARKRTGYEWVTSHVFRKTAATALDEAGLSARLIADQLGHARPSLTQDVYMHRGSGSPAAAAALDAAYRAQ